MFSCNRNRALRLARLGWALTLLTTMPTASGASWLQVTPGGAIELASPSEREDFMRLIAQIEVANGDPANTLAMLDGELAKLTAPTKLRGFVQFLRASTLNTNSQATLAMTAIEESVRLLPDYSAPLVQAAHIYTWSGQPGMAADYLIRAYDRIIDSTSTLPIHGECAIQKLGTNDVGSGRDSKAMLLD